MTATARSAKGHGWRTSPACSSWTAGRQGCASSSVRSARTPVRSCGSPTSTATGSPPSPLTRTRASSLTWSCDTGGGPGARTGSFRCAKDTGLRNLPLKGFDQNQVWCEIVALACKLLAWTQILAPAGDAGGARTAPAAPVRHGRRLVRGGRRLAPATRAELALGRRNRRRDCPAAGYPVRLTSQDSRYDRTGVHPGPWNPAHPARQPGSQARPNVGIRPWPVPQPAT